MKNICIVFDHPYTVDACHNEPHNRSFSAALVTEAQKSYEKAGVTVDVIDLHKDGFDPVMHKEDLIAWRKKKVIDSLVADYQERLLKADEIVFIFPIWWEAMPAMTKGFFDKVIAKGIIYDEPQQGKIFVNKLVNLKKVKLVTVMATPHLLYRWVFGNPVTKIVFRGTFRKMGFHKVKWLNYANMTKLSNEERTKKLRVFGNKIIK